jgi:predicted enzyme related to lactoylglutathione lyase
MNSREGGGPRGVGIIHPTPSPVVHLELHTGDLARAYAFHERVLGWRAEWVRAGSSSYLSLELGRRLGGGIVECETDQPVWLPYVGVPDIVQATREARQLGAAVLLEPREGPAGWRSVVSAPAGGELGFWQPKR